MDEKKRKRMLKVFRVLAFVMAIIMVLGIILQAFVI